MFFFHCLHHVGFNEGEGLADTGSADCDHMAVNTALIRVEVDTLSSGVIKLAEDYSLAFLYRSYLGRVCEFPWLREMSIAVGSTVFGMQKPTFKLVFSLGFFPGLMHRGNCKAGE